MGELLAGAGLGLVGGYMQNQSNAQMVGQQESFQAQMSDTAYQRQTADMKAAGLNPMFAIGSGGASSPSGSVAQTNNLGTGAIQGAQAAIQARQQQTQVENATKSTSADVILKGAQTLQANAQTKNLGLDSTQKQATSKVAQAVGDLTDNVVGGYKQLGDVTGLRSLFQGTANKPYQPKLNLNKP